jgi:hypothetical protein
MPDIFSVRRVRCKGLVGVLDRVSRFGKAKGSAPEDGALPELDISGRNGR